jgi:peroxiredoxin
MQEFQRLLPEFEQLNTQVWGVSVDMAPTQRAFAEHCGVNFKMVSGFPSHDGAKALGAFNEERSIAFRKSFIIDKEGVLRHIIDEPSEMERHANESLEILRGIEGKT